MSYRQQPLSVVLRRLPTTGRGREIQLELVGVAEGDEIADASAFDVGCRAADCLRVSERLIE